MAGRRDKSNKGRDRSGKGPARRNSRGPTGARGSDLGGRGGSRRRGIGGDQVEGRQAVLELLIAGRRRAREVVMAADLDPAPILDEIIGAAESDKVPLREVSRNKFEALARTESAQGVMAFAPPLPERELADLLTSGSEPPFLLVVDGVTDPGNLGALLRVAETAGVTGVVLPAHRAARISPSVTKAAAGAIEYVQIAQVGGLPNALSSLKESGVWTVGLDMDADTSIYDLAVATEPVALVVGAEGKGLSKLVRERCDVVASIPMRGRLDSLNVATAGAVACFEVLRRREAADRAGSPGSSGGPDGLE